MQILERALHATRHINDKSAPRAAFRFPHAFSEKQSPLAVFGRKLMHVFEFFCAASAGNPRANRATRGDHTVFACQAKKMAQNSARRQHVK
jgi:hypothetical protein